MNPASQAPSESSSAGLRLSYSDLEGLLSKLHKIPNGKQLAFRARIRALQARGLLSGTNTGSGTRVRYSFSQLMQLVIAVELMQAGMVPQMTLKLVAGSWSGLRLSILSATYDHKVWDTVLLGRETKEWLWLLHPEALQDLSVSGSGKFEAIQMLKPIQVEDFAAQMQAGADPGGTHRTLLLYGSRITRAVVALLERSGLATREDVRRELISCLQGQTC